MQTITTKYLGPTDKRGARIVATTSSGVRAVVPFSYDVSTEDCHRLAALAVYDKCGWTGRMIAGETRSGYVWVFVDDAPEIGGGR